MPKQPLKKSKSGESPSQKQFPRIYRLITEKKLFYAKLVFFSFVTTLLIVGIVLKLVELRQEVQATQINASMHQELLVEKGYWEEIVKSHPGYRDATFKLAVLSSRLGLKSDAKKYIDLTLQIDPNFRQGREFAQKLHF